MCAGNANYYFLIVIQAMREIINDKRYNALKTLGERKQAFNEVRNRPHRANCMLTLKWILMFASTNSNWVSFSNDPV